MPATTRVTWLWASASYWSDIGLVFESVACFIISTTWSWLQRVNLAWAGDPKVGYQPRQKNVHCNWTSFLQFVFGRVTDGLYHGFLHLKQDRNPPIASRRLTFSLILRRSMSFAAFFTHVKSAANDLDRRESGQLTFWGLCFFPPEVCSYENKTIGAVTRGTFTVVNCPFTTETVFSSVTEISPVKYPWIRQKDRSAQWMPKIEEPITILRLTEHVTAKFLRSFHCIRAKWQPRSRRIE